MNFSNISRKSRIVVSGISVLTLLGSVSFVSAAGPAPRPLPNGAACISIEAPSTVQIGRQFVGRVTMKNTGQSTWVRNGKNPFRLGSQNHTNNKRWGLTRVEMQVAQVVPGVTIEFTILATAPQQPGAYAFDWKMIQEGRPWFGQVCQKTITVMQPTVPVLMIKQLSIGTSDTAVKNEQNINLFAFEAYNESDSETLLTKLVFSAKEGSLFNGQNYMLLVDIDGNGVVDTIAQDGVYAQNSRVTFTDAFVLSPRQVMRFEVHADVALSLSSNTLLLQFTTSDANYIGADDNGTGRTFVGTQTDGACPVASCQIQVTTTTSKLWNLVNQGDLFVTQGVTPLPSRQLLGGVVSGYPILQLNFKAQNEEIDVTDLQISAVMGYQAASIDRLDLYKQGASVPFASASVGSCGSDLTNPFETTFCSNMESRRLVIPEEETVSVLVYPRMKSDEQGAISGEEIQLYVSGEAVADSTTGEGAVRARGGVSSNNLDANDGEDGSAEGEIFIGTNAPAANADIVGAKNVTVLSKVTSIVNANPDPDNTNVPTGVSPFGQFKFMAASNNNTLNGLNKVVLQELVFTVQAQNVEMDTDRIKFYNKLNSSVKVPCEARDADGYRLNGRQTGTFKVSCYDFSSIVDTQLNSGWSQTFVLEGDITNNDLIGANTSILQASFDTFSSPENPGSNHVTWTDKDTSSLDFFWIEYPGSVIQSTMYRS